jgi:Rieske Fe-S protein
MFVCPCHGSKYDKTGKVCLYAQPFVHAHTSVCRMLPLLSTGAGRDLPRLLLQVTRGPAPKSLELARVDILDNDKVQLSVWDTDDFRD